MEASFEIFDHTADAGIRIYAPTMPELLAPAGQGLYTLIGELVPTGEAQPLTFDLKDSDAPVLLHDYLTELLVLFECDWRMVNSVDVSAFTNERLNATVFTALVDNKRSVYHHEVKAITYHELDIRTIPGGYEATIIVDI
jgi:SHS2 domain-containing protein